MSNRMGGTCSMQRHDRRNSSSRNERGRCLSSNRSDSSHSKSPKRLCSRHSVVSAVPDDIISNLYPVEDNYVIEENGLRSPKTLAQLCTDTLCRSLPYLDGTLPPGLPQDIVDDVTASLVEHSAINATTLRVLRNCELYTLSLSGCRGVTDSWLEPLSSNCSITNDSYSNSTRCGSPTSPLLYSTSPAVSPFAHPMKCRNVERIDIDTNNKKAENDKDSLSEVFYNAKNCEYEELASHDSSSTSTFISASSRPYSPPCASSLAITQDNSFNFDDGDGDGRDCQRCNKAIHCGEKSNLPALLFPEASESQTSECDFQKDSSCRVENITISPTSHITLLDLAGSQNLTDKGLLQLSNLSSLEIAKLDNCHSIQGRGTAIFANSHRLHTLSMSHCRRLSDEAIASISHLSSLEALSLAGCRCLTDRSLFAIGNMESLTKLDLSQCDLITDYGLAELESCRNIEELLLGWCRSLTDDGIDLLVNHPERHNTLRVLSLARVPITDAGIKSIGLLLSLEELDLNGCSNISSSALGNSLSKMTKLERLDVSYCPGILRSSWQGKINSLKILDACYSAVRDSHITRLTYLPNLEELNLDSCPVGGDSAISHLETCCPNLTSLDLADTELSDLGMVHISKFSALQRLSLFYCNITNSALRHLSALTNLEVLNLDSREIGDSGLWHLRNLKNLKSLDIFSGRVTDSGCEHIAKIESLESLELCGGGITDLGCSHIAGGLENLTSLNLSQNERITNRGAAALASLTKLKTLNLSNTQVDSEALIHFSDLRSLKSLALYGCQMGTINEMQLLNGLPNLKCIRLNASSDDEFNGMISAQSVESDIGNMDSEADLVTFGSHRHSRSDQEDNETSDSSLSSSDETDGNV